MTYSMIVLNHSFPYTREGGKLSKALLTIQCFWLIRAKICLLTIGLQVNNLREKCFQNFFFPSCIYVFMCHFSNKGIIKGIYWCVHFAEQWICIFSFNHSCCFYGTLMSCHLEVEQCFKCTESACIGGF